MEKLSLFGQIALLVIIIVAGALLIGDTTIKEWKIVRIEKPITAFLFVLTVVAAACKL